MWHYITTHILKITNNAFKIFLTKYLYNINIIYIFQKWTKSKIRAAHKQVNIVLLKATVKNNYPIERFK